MPTNQRERTLIIVAITCIGLFLANWFILEPLTNAWEANSQRIVKLRNDLKNSALLESRQNVLRERWRDMASRSLPEDLAEAEQEVLADLNQWATVSGINVTSRLPSRITGDNNLGDRIEVRVQASGNLEAVTRFLYELERDPKAIRLEEATIRNSGESGAKLQLIARFTGVVLPKLKMTAEASAAQ